MHLIQIHALGPHGGLTLENAVKRLMKFVLVDELAKQFNLSGQCGKKSFSSLEMMDVVLGKIFCLIFFFKS